ncbi:MULTISPECIES: hypothetical protein [unclassified Arthrobacter]|uniref:hypothetical protein n=1 Tax=unclassified Arthrobacter TaxID=235627 RepID=UPI001D1427B0|nr:MULTISPECIES: hypothetical protein [unclassified Arthrobacter]MCC3276138.1 hypothetical protein [Arthrobacter sp. zg-Y20]MCC3277879.1 hypothetical protein [Arthrobacter sp. zg-Y40]MCC9176276.1 hypothetical protein [Arthrobacter sp. zg-Y750]MDK1316298.1 hypothetical protein [Arthrobacter sp. zg.Y20]MDK1327025.1 hypothetical protein [Arthrobacter sp. zg-Y1143]
MDPKLRVAIRLDLDLQQARLVVHGRVTDQNCRVLYVLARRANATLPGLNVVLDLRRAVVTESAMAGLTRSSETGELPVLTGRPETEALAPRQLSILAPAA